MQQFSCTRHVTIVYSTTAIPISLQSPDWGSSPGPNLLGDDKRTRMEQREQTMDENLSFSHQFRRVMSVTTHMHNDNTQTHTRLT